jgi:regulator of protease activity HflC (stomatin/prohibitin superfamily)
MLSLATYLVPVVAFVVVVCLAASVRILREYERAVVFTLGRFQRVKGPGLVLLIPFIQEMVRVDLRIQVIEIPSQDVISRDNVSMKVDAVLYFNVVNPERAIIKVQDYLPATNMLAQTTLRAVLGQHELDEMLSERKKLSADVQAILDAQTETWGIKVSNVEIRTVELTENMVRAIAKGRTRPPRQGHPCRGRVPGFPDARRRRQDPRQHPGGDAIALSPDPGRNRRRAKFDRRLPDADRHHEAVPRPS